MNDSEGARGTNFNGNLAFSWEIKQFQQFLEIFRISLKILEIAEIPRRGHWPRPSCPGLTKQSKLHRFRRGKSSQESSEPVRTSENHKFCVFINIYWDSTRNDEI